MGKSIDFSKPKHNLLQQIAVVYVSMFDIVVCLWMSMSFVKLFIVGLVGYSVDLCK